MSRRPSIFDASDFATVPQKAPAAQRAKPAPAPAPMLPAAEDARVVEAATPAKGEGDMFRTSLYLSHAVHDVLREIAHVERKKVHDLLREGIDHVLTSRLHPSIDEITRKGKA